MASTLGTIAVGVIIIIWGYLIWFRKMLFLIIGYSENTFYGDKEKYAKNVGFYTIVLGAFIITRPFAIMVFGDIAIQVYSYLLIAMAVTAVVVSNYWRFRF